MEERTFLQTFVHQNILSLPSQNETVKSGGLYYTATQLLPIFEEAKLNKSVQNGDHPKEDFSCIY